MGQLQKKFLNVHIKIIWANYKSATIYYSKGINNNNNLRKARGANFPFQCETRNINQEIIIIAITDRCLKRSLKRTSLYPQASWLVS